MLIRGELLDNFGLFDEAYSPGYNEENDFACRVNRYGYSSVAANRAFVFHHETSSFGPRRAALHERNHALLVSRFPEYMRKVKKYLIYEVDPAEHFAELSLPHVPRILFDAFNLHPNYNGTAEFALNLLRELRILLEDSCELFIGIGSEAQRFFHKELAGHRFYSGDARNPNMVFDLAFKPSQIFEWADFERINRFAPRIAFTLLDIIAVRCEYLNSPSQQMVVGKSAELADQVFTISEFSKSDFIYFYGFGQEMKVIHLATNAGVSLQERTADYILLVGNHYYHKCIEETIELLSGHWPLVVLGGRSSNHSPRVKRLASGRLTRLQIRDLFAKARLVVYPSLYEGFGLPVLDAAAMGKPIVLLETEIANELKSISGVSGVYCARNLKELPSIITQAMQAGPVTPATGSRSWRATGEEYAAAFKSLLAQDLNLKRMRSRWDCLRTVCSYAPSADRRSSG
jgi:glycosyltransferase involved in cell wall biosynthesis